MLHGFLTGFGWTLGIGFGLYIISWIVYLAVKTNK